MKMGNRGQRGRLTVLVGFAQTLFKEDGDGVCDLVEVLVALLLCSLETAGDMALDEGHRDGVGG